MIQQNTSLAEKFLKKGFWLYLFSFIIAPMGYVIKIIVSGELSVSEVGILYGIISLITLTSAFSDFGMRDSLQYFIPKYETQKKTDHIKSILFYAFILQIITGVILFSFFIFGADFIALHYFENKDAADILKIFAFFFLGINLFQLINSFFLSLQNTFLHKLTEFIRMLFTVIFTLGIFISGFGDLISYSSAWLGGLYLGVVISLIIFYYKYYKTELKSENIIISGSLIREILSYALILFFTAQSTVILSQIDMQMVLYMLGTQSAGYYTNYLSLVSIPSMILGPIFALLFPVISGLYAEGKSDEIKRIKNIFQKYFLVIGIMLSSFIFIFSLPIATTLFGSKFIISGVILQYSVLFLTWNFLLHFNYILLNSSGRAKDRLQVVCIAIVINFVSNIVLISLIGIYGAAIATGIGWVVIWILTEYKLKDFRVPFDSKYISKNLLFLCVLSLLCFYFILPIFENTGRAFSFFLLLIIGMVYFITFMLFNKSGVMRCVMEIKKIKNKNHTKV